MTRANEQAFESYSDDELKWDAHKSWWTPATRKDWDYVMGDWNDQVPRLIATVERLRRERDEWKHQATWTLFYEKKKTEFIKQLIQERTALYRVIDTIGDDWGIRVEELLADALNISEESASKMLGGYDEQDTDAP